MHTIKVIAGGFLLLGIFLLLQGHGGLATLEGLTAASLPMT